MSWHWHAKHQSELPSHARVSDWCAKWIGSWTFVVGQTIITIIWVILNIIGWEYEWDLYPFVLLNLFFSLQAFYSAPLILMAQNRQADRDRVHAQHDLEVNEQAKEEIEQLQRDLARIEMDKLDEILRLLQSATLPR